MVELAASFVVQLMVAVWLVVVLVMFVMEGGVVSMVMFLVSVVFVLPNVSFTKNKAVYWPSCIELLKVFQLPDLFVNV